MTADRRAIFGVRCLGTAFDGEPRLAAVRIRSIRSPSQEETEVTEKGLLVVPFVPRGRAIRVIRGQPQESPNLCTEGNEGNQGLSAPRSPSFPSFPSVKLCFRIFRPRSTRMATNPSQAEKTTRQRDYETTGRACGAEDRRSEFGFGPNLPSSISQLLLVRPPFSPLPPVRIRSVSSCEIRPGPRRGAEDKAAPRCRTPEAGPPGSSPTSFCRAGSRG
jgi:hypothetical protein